MKKLQVRRTPKNIVMIHKPINSEISVYKPEEVAKVLGEALDGNEYGTPASIPEETQIAPSTATSMTLTDEVADIVNEPEEIVVPTPIIKRDKTSKKRNAQEEKIEDNKEEK